MTASVGLLRIRHCLDIDTLLLDINLQFTFLRRNVNVWKINALRDEVRSMRYT